jgi:glycosyltransferase involved in cell wall biosynthesis
VNNPLRILAIANFPWDPRLGAARVYIEMAEEWKAAGHSVEKFCLTDAFPRQTTSRGRSNLRQLLFPRRVAQYIRANASRFDVIDALIGTLPFSKKQLRFDGLVVARSVGLPRVYERFNRLSQKKWSDQPRGKFVGRLFYSVVSRCLYRNSERALRCCDLINLLNEDEIPLLSDPPSISKPFIVEPNGLDARDRAALTVAIQPPEARLQHKEICFIGAWGLRKGARDWPELIRRIRKEIADVQFVLLGTMTDEQTVLRELQISPGDGIRVVSKFDREELPSLLGPFTVGLFPSYIEGFGLAVLEQLACGIPVIAYDVPGPRQILKPLREVLLVPEGNPNAMAERAAEILRMEIDNYSELSRRCRAVAGEFRWERIATETADHYRAALTNLARSS